MRKMIFASAILAASAASAADIQIDVQNFTHERGIARAVMLVKNRSSKPAKDVFIDCAFLGEDKRAIGIGRAHLESIPANGDAYDDASLVTDAKVAYADCRVRSFN